MIEHASERGPNGEISYFLSFSSDRYRFEIQAVSPIVKVIYDFDHYLRSAYQDGTNECQVDFRGMPVLKYDDGSRANHLIICGDNTQMMNRIVQKFMDMLDDYKDTTGLSLDSMEGL